MATQQQHKPGAPVVGFNHNLNYKNRTFHVQTEDSGTQHAHVITHIFMGGNIFASTKSSYADVLPGIAPGDIFATVRRLMEDQHKTMMRALVAGQHDAEIERRGGGNVYEPGVLAGGHRAPGLLVGGETPGTGTPPVAGTPPAAPPSKPPPVMARTPGPAAPPSKPPPVAVKMLDDVILAYLAQTPAGAPR